MSPSSSKTSSQRQWQSKELTRPGNKISFCKWNKKKASVEPITFIRFWRMKIVSRKLWICLPLETRCIYVVRSTLVSSAEKTC
jgi:hypothetical protein